LLKGDAADPCIEQQGIIDTTKTAEPTIGKPIGGCGKGHTHGTNESTSRIIKGDGRVLAPSHVPNRLVIKEYWSSSEILLNVNPRDHVNMMSRVLPLLVRAGIDAYPGASEMSREVWFKAYDIVLDRAWSKGTI
jgi:hypothetical protein